MQSLGHTSAKKSSVAYLTLTGCLVLYLLSFVMGEAEGMPPYLQDNFSDTKASLDQALSQSVIHFPAPSVSLHT